MCVRGRIEISRKPLPTVWQCLAIESHAVLFGWHSDAAIAVVCVVLLRVANDFQAAAHHDRMCIVCASRAQWFAGASRRRLRTGSDFVR
jgi:hypothetical protein